MYCDNLLGMRLITTLQVILAFRTNFQYTRVLQPNSKYFLEKYFQYYLCTFK